MSTITGDGRDATLEQGSQLLALAMQQVATAPDAAETSYRRAAEIFQACGAEHERATALGGVAGILQQRGDLDAALRIRTSEQLPVYERCGDVHAQTVTRAEIAEILMLRGELDTALALYQQCIPTLYELEELQGLAVSHLAVAEIYLRRDGKSSAALIRANAADAYGLYCRLGRAQEIAAAGLLLAQALMMEGDIEQSLQVFAVAESALRHGAVPRSEISHLFYPRPVPEPTQLSLSNDAMRLLSVAGLFTLSVPRIVIEVAGGAAGVADSKAALDRLLALGLLDDYGLLANVWQVQVNAHGKALAEPRDAASEPRLASAAIPPFYNAMLDDGAMPLSPWIVELARLASLADTVDATMLDDIASAAACRQFHLDDYAGGGLAVLEPALARLDALGVPPSRRFASILLECATVVESSHLCDRARQVLGGADVSALERGQEQLRVAKYQVAKDSLLARTTYDRAAEIFQELGLERERALARAGLADLLMAQGERDEAMRIWRDELLPVYRRLNDVRSQGLAHRKIVDVLRSRAELYDALMVCLERELAAFESLADERESALTWMRIADLSRDLGEPDDAERLLRDQAIGRFERVGDVRSVALARGKVADLLEARGELDEALRIRLEEELPVYEQCGDLHSRMVTRGKIADVLRSRGQLDEALRICREEQVPVFQRLRMGEELARALSRSGDILLARDAADEALRAWEDALVLYEDVRNPREWAAVLFKITDTLEGRGQAATALQMFRDLLPRCEGLGALFEMSMILERMARNLRAAQQLEAAVAVEAEKLQLDELEGTAAGREFFNFSVTDLWLRRRIEQRRGGARIIELTTRAFATYVDHGNTQGIARAGLLLGQLLSGVAREEALRVLRESEEAFEKLGDRAGAADASQLRIML